jgi:hypothetical protein
MRLRANASGITPLDLPDKGTGEKDRWRFLSDLTVTGASMREDGQRIASSHQLRTLISSSDTASVPLSWRSTRASGKST